MPSYAQWSGYNPVLRPGQQPDDEERRRQQQQSAGNAQPPGGSSAPPPPTNAQQARPQAPQSPQAPQTFAQLQANGMARPAPPPPQAGPPAGLTVDPNTHSYDQPSQQAYNTWYDQTYGPRPTTPGSNPYPGTIEMGDATPYNGRPALGPNGRPDIESYLYGQTFGYQPFNEPTYNPQYQDASGYDSSRYGGTPYNPGSYNLDPNQYSANAQGMMQFINMLGGNISGGGSGSGHGFDPGRVGAATEESVYNQLKNPSRYGAAESMDLYNRLKGNIDEQFGVDKTMVGEEMARRGLDASTIHGGRLGDLSIQHGRDLSNLAGTIATDQAQRYAGDVGTSINQALGYTNTMADIARMGAGPNSAGTNVSGLANLYLQLQDQNFGHALQGGQFGMNQQGQNWNQGIQQAGFNNDVGTTNLRNRIDTGNYNAGQQQQRFGQAMDSATFNQNSRRQNLQDLLGYGQQSFDNQMRTADYNRGQSNDQFDQWLRTMGLLG